MLRAHLPSNSPRQGAVLSGSKALVPPRMADWSVPDEPKASGKTFFLLSFYYNSLYFDHNIHSLIISIYLSIYSFCSTLISSITCSCAVSARVKRKIVGDKKCDSET